MNRTISPSRQTMSLSNPGSDTSCSHFFESEEEVDQFRHNLLSWYDENKRKLPWRSAASEEVNANVRGYAVWVSEVMLQQTQVVTVIDYYQRWMQKWPTLESLAKATLEEVNEVWSGLGYYSRGRRLWEGAQLIVDKMNGDMPRTAPELEKLPGVGRYTAGAIASIAFGEVVGLVDGNVSRVLSRMRCIGADITSKAATEALWRNANKIVAPKRPGDLNQALMELGATICMPKKPNCPQCPVKLQCKALQQVQKPGDDIQIKSEVADVEDCQLCMPLSSQYDKHLGVENYPRKSKKTKVREERSLVILIANADEEYLLFKRGRTGLLANLLEFPTFPLADNADQISSKLVAKQVQSLNLELQVGDNTGGPRDCGHVLHQFSHIKQTYEVWAVHVKAAAKKHKIKFDPDMYQESVWLTAEQLETAAVSTAMRKVFKTRRSGSLKATQSGKRKRPLEDVAPRQKRITSFFSKST